MTATSYDSGGRIQAIDSGSLTADGTFAGSTQTIAQYTPSGMISHTCQGTSSFPQLGDIQFSGVCRGVFQSR